MLWRQEIGQSRNYLADRKLRFFLTDQLYLSYSCGCFVGNVWLTGCRNGKVQDYRFRAKHTGVEVILNAQKRDDAPFLCCENCGCVRGMGTDKGFRGTVYRCLDVIVGLKCILYRSKLLLCRTCQFKEKFCVLADARGLVAIAERF